MVHFREKEDITPGQQVTKKPLTKAIAENGTSLSKYSVEDVELILNALALNGGNVTKTASQVGEEWNLEIHPNTLRRWKNEKFPTRYAEIQRNLSSKITDVVTGKIGDLAMQGTEIQESLLERLVEQLRREDDISVKDLAPALRNITQSTDLHIKQKQLLEDKPTHIVERRSVEDTIKELEDNNILIDIDPSDIEDEDIELPS